MHFAHQTPYPFPTCCLASVTFLAQDAHYSPLLMLSKSSILEDPDGMEVTVILNLVSLIPIHVFIFLLYMHA